MNQLSTRKIKNIAKDFAASLVFAAMESGAYSDLLSQEDNERLHIQMKNIAHTISNNVLSGELDNIVRKHR